jgi:putative phosphoesterase
MKIAVISDIHGNLPALKAVLEDMETRQADQIICLGDLVDFAPWGNEVIELLRRQRIITIMGNHDERIAYDLPILDKTNQSNEEKAARRSAMEFSKRTISADNKEFLKTLPLSLNLRFADQNIFFTHASPRDVNEYVYQNDDVLQEECLGLITADMLIIGHTHLPYIKECKGGLIVNVGSVGKTKEDDKKAVYALIQIIKAEPPIVEIIKVGYPVKETSDAIYNSKIPDFYAAQLLYQYP